MTKFILKNKILEYIHIKQIYKQLEMKESFFLEYLAQGEYNINFIFFDDTKKFVFRINTQSQLCLDDQITYEYNALKVLEVSGVTPKVHFVDGSKEFFEYGILIMEFLEGRSLLYKSDLQKAAKIFGRIHTLDVRNIQNVFIVEKNLCTNRVEEATRLLKSYLNSPLVPTEKKHFFSNFIEWASLNKERDTYFEINKWHCINNTEVNSSNFIIAENKSYLIDWEKPIISDPCQDITQFLAITTTLWKGNYVLNEDEIRNFYSTYLSSLGLQNTRILKETIVERVELYKPYLYLRALSWCAYAWIEYQNPAKEIQNIDTLKTINSYLESDFMKNLVKTYFKVK